MKNYTIKSTLAVLALLAAATGCKQDLDFAIPADKIGFSSTDVVNEISVFDDHYNICVIKSGKGTSTANVKIELGSALDVTAYNTANSTNYSIAASGSFTMPEETEFQFKAEETRKIAQVSWTPSNFFDKNQGTEAVIPIKISQSSIEVDTLRTLILIKPYISNASFSITGVEELNLMINDIKSLFPEGDKITASDVSTGTAQILLDKVIASTDATITLGIDNSYISEVAAARGKEYVAAPDGFAEIQEEVVVKAGELYADFTYKLNFSALFSGDELLYFGKNILIPIAIKSALPAGIGIGKLHVANIAVSISESGVVLEPSSPPTEMWGNMDGIAGTGDEWVIVDGDQYSMANDPKRTDDWYLMYNASKLVDGVFHYYEGAMGLWFWTANTFPVPFTIDLGKEYIFKGFRLADSKSHQNQYRHIQVYVARNYNEATGDGDWKLAGEGTRTFDGGWQKYPADDGSKESLYENFTYRLPEDSDPDETNSFVLTKGRYLKLVLVEPHYNTGDYEGGRGYLMEFYINGWIQDE